MKKHKIRSVLLIFGGLLLIGGGVGLVGYNFWDDARASSEANKIIEQLKKEPEFVSGTEKSEEKKEPEKIPDTEKPEEAEEIPEKSDIGRDMPAVSIDGYRYIGLVTIPALTIELPIMEEWDYTRMKISPCRYSGSVYRNDLIVCAHNYNSHFGRLDKLQADDEVMVTDTEGQVFLYHVVEINSLAGTAVEEMTSGDWDLTLFTCTYSGTARVTVRCKYVEAMGDYGSIQ